MQSAYDATLLSGANPTTPAAVHQGHHARARRARLRRVGRRAARAAARARSRSSRAIARRSIATARSSAARPSPPPLVAVIAAHRARRPGRDRPSLEPVRQPAGDADGTARSAAGSDERVQQRPHRAVDDRVRRVRARIRSTGPAPRPSRSSSTSTATAPRWSSSTPTRSTSRRSASSGSSALILVALFVLGTLAGLAPFRRGRDRALYAALFSAGLAWALHAGVDWDWQMPAASLWFAALGGLALGRRPPHPTRRARRRRASRSGLRCAPSSPARSSSAPVSSRRSCSPRRFA